MATEKVTATVHIDAPPERVYEYFTRPEAIVRWMGDYALLEPEPGGEFMRPAGPTTWPGWPWLPWATPAPIPA